jgi:hypothetical protein
MAKNLDLGPKDFISNIYCEAPIVSLLPKMYVFLKIFGSAGDDEFTVKLDFSDDEIGSGADQVVIERALSKSYLVARVLRAKPNFQIPFEKLMDAQNPEDLFDECLMAAGEILSQEAHLFIRFENEPENLLEIPKNHPVLVTLSIAAWEGSAFCEFSKISSFLEINKK